MYLMEREKDALITDFGYNLSFELRVNWFAFG